VVLTPHEGEFRGCSAYQQQASKSLEARTSQGSRRALWRHRAAQGPDTVVASADGRATIAANAPPWLATAGAGDVLAGMIAGLLAQGVPAFEAASIGAWMHGERRARRSRSDRGRSAGGAPAVFRRLYDEFGIDY